jgi:hypoxanthine phosphoribosyltransferase
MTPGGDAPSPLAWKGLDTSQMPVFIGYDQVERMVAALSETAAAWQPDAVVGIARGGLVPAAMAAGILALPLAFVGHDKATDAISWIGPPASGRKILLVDDCCSTGKTLHRARAWLLNDGRQCMTLVVVHDPDVVRHMPDLSFPMRALFRLPWERGEATPTGRATKQSGDTIDPRVEAPFVGLGLDAALLEQSNIGQPEADTPKVPVDRAVLISGLPEAERAHILASPGLKPYLGLALECRPDPVPADARSLARYKAETATRWGCTHFIECDAEQAIAISAHAPHLIVTWWSLAAGRGWTVGAAEQPRPEGPGRH